MKRGKKGHVTSGLKGRNFQNVFRKLSLSEQIVKLTPLLKFRHTYVFLDSLHLKFTYVRKHTVIIFYCYFRKVPSLGWSGTKVLEVTKGNESRPRTLGATREKYIIEKR